MFTGTSTVFASALSQHIRETAFDTSLCSVSMDHCPSEQLDDDSWHTTALVLSTRMQHDGLAHRVQGCVRPIGNAGKWSGLNTAQKARWLPAFFEYLVQTPGVLVFCISAHSTAIRASVPRLLDEFGATGLYRTRLADSDRQRVMFGPVRNRAGQEVVVDLPEKRAAMCVFIAHFVQRMKATMYSAVNQHEEANPVQVNWNFFADQFAGPPDEMPLMFQMLLSHSRHTGRLLNGGFLGNKPEPMIDLFADQLAGALDECVRQRNEGIADSSVAALQGRFYWERWPAATGAL